MTHRPTTSARAGTAAALVATALLLGACGDDDDTASAGDTPPDSTLASPEDEATAGEPDDERVVEVTAVDYGFEGLPRSVEVGTRLTLSNASEHEVHELVAFRLPDDEDRSVDELVQLPPDELLPALGGEPAAVLITPPGGEMIAAVGDGTLAEPGRYAVICVIPSGADPDEYLAAAAGSDGPPDVAGGPPHIAHGMWAELEVV